MKLMEALDHQKKCLLLILVKKAQNFACVCRIILLIVICLWIKKETLSLRSTVKKVNFPTKFCFESISNAFSATKSRKVSLKENVYNISVDYSSVGKSDTLNIYKYLMSNKSYSV